MPETMEGRRPTPRWLPVFLAGVLWFSAFDASAGPRAEGPVDVRALIAAGAVNQAAGDGSTALHWASYWEDLEGVALLIEAGADVNRATDLGVTPLWTAAENGNRAIVEALLDAGADPNAALLGGETPLMTAARAGYAEVVELLLARGADPNHRGLRGQTALMWAAAQRHPAVVEALLRHGADVHARSESWPQLWQTIWAQHDAHPDQRVWIQEGGYTPLLFAARAGDLASAKLLIAAGADVNDRSAEGRSAALLAVQSVIDHRYVPQPYREIGAGYLSPHAEPKSEGNELLAFLLESGADPDADAEELGYAPLHEAILRRNESAVQLLLAHGADPNAPVRVGTPTRRSSHDFFFDPAFVGATPFWLAARFGQPTVMRMLAERGADPHFVQHVDYWGDGYRQTGFPRVTEGPTTALMAAVGMARGRGYAMRQHAEDSEAEAQTLEAVRIAVELGVDVNAANGNGRTALDGARAQRYESVVAYLEGLGARAGAPQQRQARGEEPEN